MYEESLSHVSACAIDADLLDAPATPLVFNDSIDTANMANVLLIDSTLADKQIFYNSVNANTFPIIYDYNSKTDDLFALFRQKFAASSIQRISLAFHDRGTNFMAAFMNNKPLFQESDLAQGQTSFSDNVSFLISCMKEFHVSHIDFLACNTLQYLNWKSYYALLAAQTSVVVGASNDKTGNLNYGGDWIMENTHENVRDLYFNANISNYASTLAAITISANGTSQAIYLRMNGLIMEYSVGGVPGSYVPIASTDWPVTITNSAPTPSDSSKLRVVFTQDLTISDSYGDVLGYFIAGSTYITFDGSNNFINITNITLYPGFIQNGSIVTLTNGNRNVIVQNIKTNVTGGSLNGAVTGNRAGWICAGSFGRGALENQIINCSNNGAISTPACGGICGDRPGTLGGSVTFVNCTNSGTIGIDAGGIVAVSSGRFSGSATFINCTNTGVISGSGAGGISSPNAGLDSGSVTFTGCTNTGNISGNNAGGITGRVAGNNGGSATFTSCINSGTISGNDAGGIAGQSAGYSGSATITGCTNTGEISASNAGGIAGAYAGYSGSATITGCTNSGPISGGSAGGIAGLSAGYSGSASITDCTNSGNISGGSAGGIAGQSAGFTNGSATITGCTNSGAISGQFAGGIAGSKTGFTNGSVTFTDCTNSGTIGGNQSGGIAGAQAGQANGLVTFTLCTNTGDITSAGTNAGGIAGTRLGFTNGSATITNCTNAGAIGGQSAGGIAGVYFASDTSINCVISGCYSTGAISGSNAGGIVGADIGYTTNALIIPNVNITNSYSLGTIATTCGGICGGTVGSTYAASPNITITNCYSFGTIVDANSGIVSVLYPKPTTKINTYVAAGAWTDAAANASLALIGTPTNINTNNPGSIWTTLAVNTPYVLSAYNAAVYSPSSASTSSSTYTSAAGLFSPGYNYQLIYTDQVGDVITARVFASKGSAPYYNSYNSNTFTLSILTGLYAPSVTINPSTGAMYFILSRSPTPMRNAPMISGGGGSFWFGVDGFLYKRKGGGGARRSTKMAPGGNTTCNGPTYIYNKYNPGNTGVGAQSTAVRRAKNIKAAVCGPKIPCGQFYNYLGLYDNYTGNPNGYFIYPRPNF